jgi:hypothetical protein
LSGGRTGTKRRVRCWTRCFWPSGQHEAALEVVRNEEKEREYKVMKVIGWRAEMRRPVPKGHGVCVGVLRGLKPPPPSGKTPLRG